MYALTAVTSAPPTREGTAAARQIELFCTPSLMAPRFLPNEHIEQADMSRLHHGPLTHQVIALAATGQLDMAAAGQIWLAVVTSPKGPTALSALSARRDHSYRDARTRLPGGHVAEAGGGLLDLLRRWRRSALTRKFNFWRRFGARQDQSQP